MYHYVREFDKNFPYFYFLQKKDFLKQILIFKNYLKLYENYHLNLKKNILTFDDGLKDHLSVAKILSKKKIKGIFFINTFPILEKKILNVHKLHFILGKYKSHEILKYLKKINFSLNSSKKIVSFKEHQIKNSFNDEERKKIIIKSNLNFRKNKNLISKMFNFFFTKENQKEIFESLYLNEEEIKKIKELGMIIGGHSHNHNNLANLSYKEQLKDLSINKLYLEKILNKKIEFFAFPFGHVNTWNANTIKILQKLNYKYVFTTHHKKIYMDSENYLIPRQNCNKYKFGKIFNFFKNVEKI